MAHGVILGQTSDTNNLLPLDGSRAMTGSLNMASHKITNLSNGTANNDAVNYYQLMNSTVSASRISGTLSTSNIPNLSASKITSGTFSTSRIPSLDASKITSGQFNIARIPNLSASKITSGVLSVANGGTGVSSLDALTGLTIKKQTFTFEITDNSRNYYDIVPRGTILQMPIPFCCSLEIEPISENSWDYDRISFAINDSIIFGETLFYAQKKRYYFICSDIRKWGGSSANYLRGEYLYIYDDISESTSYGTLSLDWLSQNEFETTQDIQVYVRYPNMGDKFHFTFYYLV